MLAVTAPNPERLVELEAACAAHAGEARRWAIKLRRQSPALKLATLKVALAMTSPLSRDSCSLTACCSPLASRMATRHFTELLRATL
jgi:hypothetical protein